MQAGECCAADQITAVCTAYRKEISSKTVTICDCTSFIKNHGIYVAASLHSFTGHSDNIKAGNTIHASNTDCRKQAANGGRNQTDSQGD